MHIFANDSTIYGDDGERAEHRTTVRVEVDDPERYATRVWVDDEGRFWAVELRVEAEDQVIESTAGMQYGHQPLVRWEGNLVPPVLGATGSVWASSESWEDRLETIDSLRAIWIDYMAEPPEFRSKWSYYEYSMGDHLPHDGDRA